MRRFLLGAMAALVAMAGLAYAAEADEDGLAARIAQAPQALFAPAYDTVTQASMGALVEALRSREIVHGTLDGLEVAELADWGWEPSETMTVVITVDGHDFCVVARDVRPGSSTFHVASTAGAAGSPLAAQGHTDAAHEALPAQAGVRVVTAASRS